MNKIRKKKHLRRFVRETSGFFTFFCSFLRFCPFSSLHFAILNWFLCALFLVTKPQVFFSFFARPSHGSDKGVVKALKLQYFFCLKIALNSTKDDKKLTVFGLQLSNFYQCWSKTCNLIYVFYP